MLLPFINWKSIWFAFPKCCNYLDYYITLPIFSYVLFRPWQLNQKCNILILRALISQFFPTLSLWLINSKMVWLREYCTTLTNRYLQNVNEVLSFWEFGAKIFENGYLQNMNEVLKMLNFLGKRNLCICWCWLVQNVEVMC